MKMQLSDTFSVDSNEVDRDSMFVEAKGFGVIRLDVGFRELTICVFESREAVKPKFEVTIPHEAFGDDLPTIKVREKP